MIAIILNSPSNAFLFKKEIVLIAIIPNNPSNAFSYSKKLIVLIAIILNTISNAFYYSKKNNSIDSHHTQQPFKCFFVQKLIVLIATILNNPSYAKRYRWYRRPCSRLVVFFVLFFKLWDSKSVANTKCSIDKKLRLIKYQILLEIIIIIKLVQYALRNVASTSAEA